VFASSNTLIQMAVPDQLRGRVMALFSVSLQGMVSVGQLLMGGAADYLRVSVVVLVCGILLLLLTVTLARRLYRLPITGEA